MFIIEPFLNVSKYIFGSTQSEIKAMNGEPFKIEIDNIMKQTKEIRKGVELIFKDEKLVGVYIQQTESTSFKGIDIFNDPNAIEKLKQYSDF